MQKRHIKVLCTTFLFAWFILYIVFNYFPISNRDFLNSIVSILSITFGFNIAALASLFGRDLLQKMSQVEAEKTIIKQTQLQSLLTYFRCHAYSSLSILICCLVYQSIQKYHIIFDSFVVAATVTIILLTCLLVRIFTCSLTKIDNKEHNNTNQ